MKQLIIGTLLYAATLATAQAADPWSGDGGVSDFYQWQQPVPEKAGQMLRQEPLPPALQLANAQQSIRVLYSSHDGADGTTPVAVSGAIFLPKGPTPEGGWPIVAWAHGTIGVADICAPSWGGRSPSRVKYLNRWLAKGYAVVATDYQGLGTAGLHPYLLFRPEGYSLLDNVRAALASYPQLANKVMIVGQSQGGGAALGAGYVAPQYAADINVVGVIATGPAINIRDTGKADQLRVPLYEDDGPYSSAFETLFLLGTIRGINPELKVEDYVTDKGKSLLTLATKACFHDVIDEAKRNNIKLGDFYKKSISTLNKMQTEYGELPNGQFAMPVFVGTGLKDTAVVPAKQYNLVSAMCDKGSVIDWHRYRREDHLATVNASFADAAFFAKQLMAGQQLPGNCSSVTPPTEE